MSQTADADESLGELALAVENRLVDGELEEAESATEKLLGEIRRRKAGGDQS